MTALAPRSALLASNATIESWRTRAGRRVLERLLEELKDGCVELIDGPERKLFGEADRPDAPRAAIIVVDRRFYSNVLLGGSIGAGESYARGDWATDDLSTLVRILIRNLELADRLDSGWSRLRRPLDRLRHWSNRNNRSGSRRNISAHYDLGNDFFSLFLDETMSYSCLLFDEPDEELSTAARRKNDLICRKLQLSAGDEVLEIGTGWGGFALHAAGSYGCRVTTTTISQRQFDLATERVAAAGLDDRVTILREDYRELPAKLGRRFDKLVSVEMIEAVGHRFLPRYFRTCGELLKPEGAMLLQAITIADQRYDQYRRSVDFINRYIFPGGCVPSVTAMTRAMTEASPLRLFHMQDISSHYATTLRRWAERLRANRERAGKIGYDEELVRLWDFYFGYCEGAFRERYTGDVQLLLHMPGNRRTEAVPQF